MRAFLELGRWPFQAPLGYAKGESASKGLLTPDPVRAPIVRAAFELFATGGYTKIQVLCRITGMGLTTASGKPLTPQSLGNLFRNPIYCGWLKVPRWDVSARGDFEALIPETLFRCVQRILDGKTPTVRPHTRNHVDFPLRRFVACAHCETPLTGSWSSGRSKKYAYYHCPKCVRVHASKRQLESAFTGLLTQLRPEDGYMRLFKAIVLDVWKAHQAEARELRAHLERVVRDKTARLDRVDEAFLHERSIDRQTYERQRDRLREEVALAQIELQDAVINQFDIEGVLGFAEHLFKNAARLWMELGLDQKQQLQQVLFPKGLRFDGERFGTAITCLAFKQIGENGGPESSVASPTGTTPLRNSSLAVAVPFDGAVRLVA